MKRFNEWLNRIRPAFPLYAALGRVKGFDFMEAGGQLVSVVGERTLYIDPPAGIPPGVWRGFCGRLTDNDHDRFEAWSIAGMCSAGVKVFHPTAEQYRALSRVELNVTWADYRQPFETFVVTIPDGAYPQRVSGDIGIPSHCLIRHSHERRVCVLTIAGSGGAAVTGRCAWPADTTASIEEYVGGIPFDDDVELSEIEMMNEVKRVAINACLMLTNYGARRLGFENPEHAAKLAASLKKKLPDNIREANRTALKLIPDVYAFDQSVRLFDREGDGHGGEVGGYEVKPHWRRGHWRNQGVGVGRAGRRLVFVRPVLVNAHKFRGDQFDTRATYTTA